MLKDLIKKGEIMAGNYLLNLLEAVAKDQSSMSKMEMVDSKSTEVNVKELTILYAYWNNNVLKKDIANIKSAVKHHDSPGWISTLQQVYNADSAKAQAAESQQDGAVKSSQGQTSSDATNLQMKAQIVQSINSIEAALANMMGQAV